MRLVPWLRRFGVPLLLVSTLLAWAQPAQAEAIRAVTSGNLLISFDSATPGTLTSQVMVTGLQLGEQILGIDIRPANGTLYALGSTSRLYTVNVSTGAATQVGSPGAFTLSGTSFGFDFNPTVDRIRVTSDLDQNIRLNPNDGLLAATDVALNPGNPNVIGSAYTNNFAGAVSTMLYDIDSVADTLLLQINPNGGTLSPIGPLGINILDTGGFDISGLSAIAYVALTTGTAGSQLFRINLTTGAAMLVGNIGQTPLSVTALAAPIGTPVPEPAALAMLGAGLIEWARRRRTTRRR